MLALNILKYRIGKFRFIGIKAKCKIVQTLHSFLIRLSNTSSPKSKEMSFAIKLFCKFFISFFGENAFYSCLVTILKSLWFAKSISYFYECRTISCISALLLRNTICLYSYSLRIVSELWSILTEWYYFWNIVLFTYMLPSVASSYMR